MGHKIESDIDGYPGYIELPTPLEGKHIRKWHPVTQNVKGVPAADYENTGAMKLWRGAVALVETWAIEGIDPADIDASGDLVPLEVLTWAGQVVNRYVADHISIPNS